MAQDAAADAEHQAAVTTHQDREGVGVLPGDERLEEGRIGRSVGTVGAEPVAELPYRVVETSAHGRASPVTKRHQIVPDRRRRLASGKVVCRRGPLAAEHGKAKPQAARAAGWSLLWEGQDA